MWNERDMLLFWLLHLGQTTHQPQGFTTRSSLCLKHSSQHWTSPSFRSQFYSGQYRHGVPSSPPVLSCYLSTLRNLDHVPLCSCCSLGEEGLALACPLLHPHQPVQLHTLSRHTESVSWVGLELKHLSQSFQWPGFGPRVLKFG